MHPIKTAYALPQGDAAEDDRLELQHLIALAVFDGPVVGPARDILSRDARVLDVGTGPGSWIKVNTT